MILWFILFKLQSQFKKDAEYFYNEISKLVES